MLLNGIGWDHTHWSWSTSLLLCLCTHSKTALKTPTEYFFKWSLACKLLLHPDRKTPDLETLLIECQKPPYTLPTSKGKVFPMSLSVNSSYCTYLGVLFPITYITSHCPKAASQPDCAHKPDLKLQTEDLKGPVDFIIASIFTCKIVCLFENMDKMQESSPSLKTTLLEIMSHKTKCEVSLSFRSLGVQQFGSYFMFLSAVQISLQYTGIWTHFFYFGMIL